ncbi:MAG: Gfo/Idh/MocA family oxidoreductase [Chloroflexota bacterium]
MLQKVTSTREQQEALTKTLEEIAPRKLLNIGVIGYGYWGPKLVRNFQELPTTQVTMVSDLNTGRLDELHKTYPAITLTSDYHELLASDVDAVVVATPITTHFPIARDCLLAGKHVLIEKPFSHTSQGAQELIDIAAARNLIAMVGHTFEYNPAVEMLKDIVASGELGRVYYAYTSRTNLGIFQKDVNVMWDLAPHDVSILLYVLGKEVINVSAVGGAFVQPGIHDVARLTVNFTDQIQAHIHVSWLDPCKVRRVTIVGDKKMVVYDDIEMLEKLKIYDKGVQVPDTSGSYGEFHLSYRYGNITIPRVALSEPLKVECEHYAQCISKGMRPRSSGEVGLSVVRVLESAEESLHDSGRLVPVVR